MSAVAEKSGVKFNYQYATAALSINCSAAFDDLLDPCNLWTGENVSSRRNLVHLGQSKKLEDSLFQCLWC